MRKNAKSNDKNLNGFKVIQDEILKSFALKKEAEKYIEAVKKRGLDQLHYTIVPSNELYNKEVKHNEDLWKKLKYHNSIYIGDKGNEALADITSRLLKDPKKNIKSKISFQTLRQSIVDHFILATFAHSKELDASSVEWILNNSIKSIVKNTTRREYFFPCSISFQHEEDDFSIGPVRFMTKKLFYDENYERIKNERKDIYVDELDKFYKNVRWIAQVTIKNIEEKQAEEVAKQACQYALYVIKLAFELRNAKRIKIITSNISDKRCSLNFNEEKPNITIEMGGDDVMLGDKAFSTFVAKEYQDIFFLAGQLINHFVTGEKMPLMYQRLLNAIWWFGEATDELLSGSMLIKFVKAIESLVNTKSSDATNQFRDRTEKLLIGIETDIIGDKKDLHSRLNKLYSKRSSLVHGSLHPNDDDIIADSHFIFHIANCVIVAGFDWTLYLAKKNVDASLKAIGNEFDNNFGNFNEDYEPPTQQPKKNILQVCGKFLTEKAKAICTYIKNWVRGF